jgi:hypothetical protein
MLRENCGKLLLPVIFLYIFLGNILGCNYGYISRKDLCKGIQNNYECAILVERQLISRLKGRVSRHDSKLVLILNNGLSVAREDSPGEEFDGWYDPSGNVNRKFTLFDYLGKEDYFLVEGHYYEGHTFELINAKTGDVTEIGDKPIFSPDRKHFVIVKEDYGVLSWVEVWLFNPPRINREFSYKPHDWPYVIAKWSSSSNVDLFEWNPSAEKGLSGKIVARITYKNGNWEILQSP